MRVLAALYSACVYALFLAVFLYFVGFVEGIGAPKTIDSGAVGGLGASLAVDLALLTAFALQHSVMARPSFKRAWTRIVPEAAERSTYVLVASLLLALLCWQWRPLPAPVWSAEAPLAAGLLIAVSAAGWGLALLSTFLISHFHLFGLHQGFSRLFGLDVPPSEFVTPLFYRLVRHPLYAGFLLAFWAAPRMSLGHMVFAIGMTAYVLVAIWFEDRDLVATFGARYLEYRRQVGMLLPRLRPSRTAAPSRPAE